MIEKKLSDKKKNRNFASSFYPHFFIGIRKKSNR